MAPVSIDERCDGDVLILTPTGGTTMQDIIKPVYEKLSGSRALSKDVERIHEGEHLRPDGNFAMYLQKNQLYLDNRNGRGIDKYRNQLAEAAAIANDL